MLNRGCHGAIHSRDPSPVQGLDNYKPSTGQYYISYFHTHSVLPHDGDRDVEYTPPVPTRTRALLPRVPSWPTMRIEERKNVMMANKYHVGPMCLPCNAPSSSADMCRFETPLSRAVFKGTLQQTPVFPTLPCGSSGASPSPARGSPSRLSRSSGSSGSLRSPAYCRLNCSIRYNCSRDIFHSLSVMKHV